MSKTTATDVFVVTNASTSTGGITLTGGNYSTNTYNTGGYITNSLINYPTYNDFWKFDEEFDLLWKSFFSNDGYKPIREKVAGIPYDIQETDTGLCIELAAVGLEKSDLDIIVDSETLRVAYRKSDKEDEAEKNEYRYLLRSIKKSSFDLAWKISSKYNLQHLEAKLEKGLLTLDIPFAKENKPTKVTIK